MKEVSELNENHFTDFVSTLMPGQIAPALFQALPEIVFWMKDKDGYFRYVNQAFCHEMNCTQSSDLMGKKDSDLFPLDLAKVFQKGDEQVMRTKESIWNKLELVPNRMGVIEWRLISKIPLLNIDGNCVGSAGISKKMDSLDGAFHPTPHHKLAIIVATIYEHLDKNITITKLSQSASISLSTLERLFKTHMGTTPKRFINQAKISTACEKLIQTNLQIKEIGHSLGYPEASGFTRSFQKIIGMSPRAYQKIYRKE